MKEEHQRVKYLKKIPCLLFITIQKYIVVIEQYAYQQNVPL